MLLRNNRVPQLNFWTITCVKLVRWPWTAVRIYGRCVVKHASHKCPCELENCELYKLALTWNGSFSHECLVYGSDRGPTSAALPIPFPIDITSVVNVVTVRFTVVRSELSSTAARKLCNVAGRWSCYVISSSVLWCSQLGQNITITSLAIVSERFV